MRPVLLSALRRLGIFLAGALLLALAGCVAPITDVVISSVYEVPFEASCDQQNWRPFKTVPPSPVSIKIVSLCGDAGGREIFVKLSTNLQGRIVVNSYRAQAGKKYSIDVNPADRAYVLSSRN